MKKLIICGKANMEKGIAEIKEKNSELWMCGTDPREGADRYFELHGIEVKHQNVITELPKEVYELGLPVNNTICALLVFAYLSGYTKVTILGAPMNATHEYIEQRPALAYIVGYLNGSGMKIKWDAIPQTVNYGNKESVKAEDDIEEAEDGSNK